MNIDKVTCEENFSTTDAGKWYVIEILNCDVSRSTRFAINVRARMSGTIEVNCSIVTAINYTRP